MRVAIIEDEKVERERIIDFIERFSEEFHKKIEVEEFDSGDSLLSTFMSVYDIMIFDIDMPGTNGMDTARLVREKDKRAVILFMTNIAQYAVNGYEVDAVDYIIKPIGYFDFSMKFQKAVRRAAKRQDNYIAVDALDGMRKLKVSDIRYVEVLGHYLIYHLADSELKLRGSMKEQAALLGAYNFTQIHKSYLVNLAYVENISGNEILVDGGILTMGRVYKERVMQEYLRYIRG